MRFLLLSLIYLCFFLSGGSALMYEVVWVRSLSLVFGGSHLAVTTVLSIFMSGLALGSYLIGRNVQRFGSLLRLYGVLEIGIALFAGVFLIMMKVYPPVYIFLAQLGVDSPLYLTLIRIAFSFAVLIVPTTLMGGTLPVLSSFVSKSAKEVGSHLSFLYGFNTLGAVAGAASAGFVFLRFFSVNTTMLAAMIINLTIGILCISLQSMAQAVLGKKEKDEGKDTGEQGSDLMTNIKPERLFSFRLVLWGIGVSGFCALGYEILWTRVLIIILGGTSYVVTTMLVAFLMGIGLGGSAYGVFLKLARVIRKGRISSPLRAIVGFGLVQIIIGIAAIFVTMHFFDLPVHAHSLQDYLQAGGIGRFGAKHWAGFIVAFLYMFVPAFFMGVAFPLAGRVHAEYKNIVGRAVGEILAYNTVGAILGAAVSGFALIYLLGIERSLQMLGLVNIGFGFLVAISTLNAKGLNLGVSGLTAVALLGLSFSPDIWRVWDSKYIATYQSNKNNVYSPEDFRERLGGTTILYYAEGAESIVSSSITGGAQSFITNGRAEASNSPRDQQCLFALGHIPMLLNKDPKNVLVIGTGTGMTLGSVSLYPSVEKIILAEIEPKVIGVARTFAAYNHNVLDNPKLKVVFNDGRNYLLTTKEKFDVITADPIHPWFRGSGYLYTTEYFRLAAAHLRPGGIICQWLPVYEMTEENLRSVVNTFRQNFKYTMVWLTYLDIELIGSNDPIVIDEAELGRRISAVPEISRDLKQVMMGSSDDFLSYFVMGTEGSKNYGDKGIINTDDNLYLEFSAPLSIGKVYLDWENVSRALKYREDIVPYLRIPEDPSLRAAQKKKWEEIGKAQRLTEKAHVLLLSAGGGTRAFSEVAEELDKKYPSYAFWRFLKNEL